MKPRPRKKKGMCAGASGSLGFWILVEESVAEKIIGNSWVLALSDKERAQDEEVS